MGRYMKQLRRIAESLLRRLVKQVIRHVEKIHYV
jgi:hypothetical protein